MSTVSASQTGPSLYSYLRTASVAPSDSSSAVSGSSGADATSQSGPAGRIGARQHHGGGHGALFGKIKQAVTDALQSASSDGSSDPNQIVQDAITKVLQANKPAASPDGSPPAGGQPPSGPPGGPNASGADSAQNAFLQKLKGFGIDPQQFREDFRNAVSSARNGNANVSGGSTFKSFPAGLAVDTAA